MKLKKIIKKVRKELSYLGLQMDGFSDDYITESIRKLLNAQNNSKTTIKEASIAINGIIK